MTEERPEREQVDVPSVEAIAQQDAAEHDQRDAEDPLNGVSSQEGPAAPDDEHERPVGSERRAEFHQSQRVGQLEHAQADEQKADEEMGSPAPHSRCHEISPSTIVNNWIGWARSSQMQNRRQRQRCRRDRAQQHVGKRHCRPSSHQRYG